MEGHRPREREKEEEERKKKKEGAECRATSCSASGSVKNSKKVWNKVFKKFLEGQNYYSIRNSVPEITIPLARAP